MIKSDMHLHTNLSRCAPVDTTIMTYLPYCKQEGLHKIGIANHIYESYDNKRGIYHLLEIKNQLKDIDNKDNIQILIGGEAETVLHMEPTISYDEARELDYLQLGASHVLNIMHYYEKYDLSTPKKLRDLTIELFYHACSLEYPIPTIICHPLYPICSPYQEEIIASISDNELVDCFTYANKMGKIIELHADVYRTDTSLNEHGLSDTYLRINRVAKSCGCKFSFGTDSHRITDFLGYHKKLEKAAELIGLTEDDIADIAK